MHSELVMAEWREVQDEVLRAQRSKRDRGTLQRLSLFIGTLLMRVKA